MSRILRHRSDGIGGLYQTGRGDRARVDQGRRRLVVVQLECQHRIERSSGRIRTDLGAHRLVALLLDDQRQGEHLRNGLDRELVFDVSDRGDVAARESSRTTRKGPSPRRQVRGCSSRCVPRSYADAANRRVPQRSRLLPSPMDLWPWRITPSPASGEALVVRVRPVAGGCPRQRKPRAACCASS